MGGGPIKRGGVLLTGGFFFVLKTGRRSGLDSEEGLCGGHLHWVTLDNRGRKGGKYGFPVALCWLRAFVGSGEEGSFVLSRLFPLRPGSYKLGVLPRGGRGRA